MDRSSLFLKIFVVFVGWRRRRSARTKSLFLLSISYCTAPIQPGVPAGSWAGCPGWELGCVSRLEAGPGVPAGSWAGRPGWDLGWVSELGAGPGVPAGSWAGCPGRGSRLGAGPGHPLPLPLHRPRHHTHTHACPAENDAIAALRRWPWSRGHHFGGFARCAPRVCLMHNKY